MDSRFVHLHLHSEYSLLDGACRIKDIVACAKSSGQSAVAITDHGVMYGAVEFYNEAKKQGIKPIIGCEVYVARRTRNDKEYQYDSSPYHLILLCENNTGYKNLIRLVSESFISGFYSKPRVDTELLEKYHEGLICLSACLAGEVAFNLMQKNYKAAKSTAEKYRDIFGKENYYIEIQNHNIPEQKNILPGLYRLSAETGIPLVATNDVHYVSRRDSQIQKVLLCIQTNTTLDEPTAMAFPTNEFYMKSEDEMLSLFPNVPEAVYITSKIAQRCNVEFEFGVTRLPEFAADGCTDNALFFRKLCTEGLYQKYGQDPPSMITDRMDYEISVITSMGYIDYYLIVWDFINYARSVNIPVGPGRGSGAGSICAYCIGITAIDPIKYNLIFERFLNPERVSMPDFDVDFCVERRAEVIDYVIKKYGADRVAQIITFDTMAAKSAVRDAGRAMNIPYPVCDKTAKLISSELNTTIEKSLEKEEELRKLYESDLNVHRLLDMAQRIEGMPRNTSVHAAGVVIANAPVSDFVPLKTGKDNIIMTQYPMSVLESLGLLKVDFLGLRNLTIIRSCMNIINSGSEKFDIDKISTDDAEVYTMLSKGETSGVFQFESQGIRSLLTRLVPETLEDIIAAIALYRPGPMDSIPRYIHNKHNPADVTYKHPLLENILDVTYGCIIYQEQVMEIFRTLAGYSYGRADLVRRAMAKKKRDVMEKEREFFVHGMKNDDGKIIIPGAVANGVPEDVADSIFDEMASFASYAFNKSHAAAYAYLAYQTAYLRCHYFKEYMASIMTYCLTNPGKLIEYISECESNGVKLIRPSINESYVGFTVVPDGIRFGLSAIKNIGRGIVEEIIKERSKNGNFSSICDFIRRTSGLGMSRRMTESLINAGAFDGMGLNRRQMSENIDTIILSQSDNKNIIEGQLDMFGESENEYTMEIPLLEEYPFKELLKMEKEATGMYISGHPLQHHLLLKKLFKVPDILQLAADQENQYTDDTHVNIIAVVNSVKPHFTKKNDKMCFTVLEDNSGDIECVVFPKVYQLYGRKFVPDEIVMVSGRITHRDENAGIIADVVYSQQEFMQLFNGKKICIKTDSQLLNKSMSLFDSYYDKNGNVTVCFYLEDMKKIVSRKEKNRIIFTEEVYELLKKNTNQNNIAFI